ncbi:glycosyltransferase 87 family protein [Nocardia abscessus]|uniref:glycosyltransferase 87 family protein n=1 Tax=Nocardia abscessus TaxID=120957 RepID=UPI0009FE2A4D|nr:glycosyltransferase 87 family protein [Nocardia abscessus]MCC3326470.1 glycosyltransferase 87 family protein [Nocardia abscessus]
MERNEGSTEVDVPRKWAVLAVTSGVVASGVQAAIVPFTAAPQFGLLVNQGDLEIYRNAARAVLNSEPLYVAPIPPGGWFTYPPFAALCFIPFALTSFSMAKIGWFAVSCAALWATIWRCCRALRYRASAHLVFLSGGLGLVAIGIEAVRGTLWQGQINLVLMAILVWDLTRPPSAQLRGFSVGLVTGIKLSAIIFFPYLLLTRQWRAAVTAVSTGSVTVAVAWLTLPVDTSDFLRYAAGNIDRIGPVTHPGNQSINGVLSNLWTSQHTQLWVWVACAVIAATLGYTAAVIAHRDGQSLLGIVVIGLNGCVVSPLAWAHHWVWLAPLLVLLVHSAIHADRNKFLTVATATGTYAVSSMWLTSWLYVEIKQLGLVGAPTYIPAMTAAVEQMPRPIRAIVCGAPVTVYLTVVTTVLTRQRNGKEQTSTLLHEQSAGRTDSMNATPDKVSCDIAAAGVPLRRGTG